MSARFEIDPRAAARVRFTGSVLRKIQRAFTKASRERGLTKADIAKTLGLNRSVITKRLKGQHLMSQLALADLAHAMEFEIDIVLRDRHDLRAGSNHYSLPTKTVASGDGVGTSDVTSTASEGFSVLDLRRPVAA